jgi:hypothetical protein
MAVAKADKEYKRGSGVVKVYQHSPFTLSMNTKTKCVTNKAGTMMLINKEDCSVVGEAAGFYTATEIDATQFVKLFVQGVRALTELTSAGTKMFELLYLKMQSIPNHDQVNLGFWTIDQKITPISERTHARGMSELIAKGFIAATPSNGLYWINPSFMWNGDRLSFRNDYVKKSSIKPSSKALVIDPNQQLLPF